MHYSDDEDDLVGPRRGGASRSRDNAPDGDDDLVGPRRGPRAASARDAADADDDELVGHRRGARRRSILDDDEEPAPRPAPRRRRGGHRDAGLSRESLMGIVRDVPSFIKLFGRLATDPRVSKVDKAIVAAVVVYLVSPVDLVPDWVVPVVGQIEDVYLLALALSRLVNNAGVDVLMDHWQGDPASLEAALAALDRAGSVLPGPIQALLGARR
ncbi:YkvA family protein [Longimicrobium sp.]|uniref:YkvA family protein n=1 Tax=Longimicrobium sp. TaxID=2029185 RepID=UPI002E310541|nr:YkvA family protein [Longimicrobium sp.]HEX6039566.1 YkvA family protein [Longimicrobium sp.]